MKKILICTIVVLMITSIFIGCSNKAVTTNKDSNISDSSTNTISKGFEVKSEDLFKNMPENSYVSPYMNKLLSNYDEYNNDALKVYDAVFKKNSQPEIVEKYNLKPEEYTDTIQIYNDAPEIYQYVILNGLRSVYTEYYKNSGIMNNAISVLKKNMISQLKGYLTDVWGNNKESEYYLNEDFASFNPQKVVGEYLTKNKVTSLEIVYFDMDNGFRESYDTTGFHTMTCEVKFNLNDVQAASVFIDGANQSEMGLILFFQQRT